MSNSSIRITQLSLHGESAWPDLNAKRLSPQLNVFYGPPRTGKSSVAQLVGHLLYGKSDSSWRRQFGQTLPNASGYLQLDGLHGKFELRRTYDVNRQSRLTISSGRGDEVDSQVIDGLLAGLSPQLAERVFFVDFAESPRADWLLSESFAREFTNSRPAKSAHQGAATSSVVDSIDRRRVDELVKRRDAIAGEIQRQMSVRRNESEVLERELAEVDAALTGKRQHMEQLQSSLHGVDAELAGLEARLRYLVLASKTHDSGQQHDVELLEKELTELDEEISGCRQSIAHLQQRESQLHTDLANFSPDGTADSVTCLTDGRATLGALERLLDDLDAEVSQLARASEPGRAVSRDTHARISPVASQLRQQVYTLCGQLTEQERSVRRQQLSAESRQLARVRTELGQRLDLLLTRREALIHRAQRTRQPVQFDPQLPSVDHCRCEHHGEFVQSADATWLDRVDCRSNEADTRDRFDVLQRERIRLADQLDNLQEDLQHLETRWQSLQGERAGLINGASIENQQAELERLEGVIRQSLQSTDSPRDGIWRASDVLAQLTNGQLVQIRLDRHESRATIVDRQGQPRTLESLSPAEHDQLYLALTLSLVSAYAQRGVLLPLVLDEPFLQQTSAQAAAMVGVLDEFARAGHQLLVFTEDRQAQQRFSTLSARLFDLEALHKATTTRPVETLRTLAPPTTGATNKRVVRETFDGHATPVLQLATVDGDPQQDDVFYLTEDASFDDFPVLGANTSALLSAIGIHTIGDLLAADALRVSQQLGIDHISSDTVQLWQIHIGIMCHVPNITLDDAQILAAGGVRSPDDLCEADVDQLRRSIGSFLRSDQGKRFRHVTERYGRSRLNNWRTAANTFRDRWRRMSHRYANWYAHPTRPSAATKKSRRQYYLSREQDVEAAPSIGPKTATRLAKIGIHTIAEFLDADPESTAAELDVSHISAAKLTDWQHQARLVCQIPELRGYGAQLLVACGLTQPEQIAGSDAETLVAQVLSLCKTKEGQRILRSSDPPHHDKIAKWVELAAHSRPLEAA